MVFHLLKSICVFSFLWIISPAFSQCPTDIKLTRQTQADSFFIYYPGCTTLTDLTIRGDSFPYAGVYGNVNDLQGLLGIKRVNGTLLINNGRSMKSLSGLDSLKYVGYLKLIDIDSLTNLTGLESLEEVGATITINSIDELRTLTGLDGLRKVETILLGNNYKLITLEGLESLSQHPYRLAIGNSTLLESLAALHNANLLWGLSITNCPGLTNLNDLENLTGLGSLRLDENINLVDIKGLKNLEDNLLVPSITITNNPKLISLEGLEKLTRSDDIIISNNDLLNDLRGLENLRRVGTDYHGDIIIEGNDALQSIHALDSVSAVAGKIEIRDNPLLSECNIYTVCEAVQYSTDPTDIMNNAPGCNSIPEVITTCDFQYGYATGEAYLDMDCNGAFNQDDYVLPNYIIESAENNFPLSATSDQGIYRRYLFSNDTIEIRPRPLKYFTTYPDSYSVISNTTYLIIDSLDFRLCPDTLFHDLSVSMVITGFRPGFGFGIYICIRNLGTYVEDAIVTFDFSSINDQYITLLSAESGGVINGTTVTWELSDLFLYQSLCFGVQGELSASTPLGTILKPRAIITSATGVTEDLSNNEIVLTESVVGSLDPNDKSVNLERIPYSDTFQSLNYTIRFQNTGTFPATFIEIVDTLESTLDIRSFEMIAASHSYTLSFPDTNIIKWRFDNINLPDSTANEPESHGFVHFKINARKSLSANTEIANKAAIYFDFNDPVITNSTSTIIELPVHTNVHVDLTQNVSIDPNPNSGQFYLNFELTESAQINIELFNVHGHSVFSKKTDTLSQGHHRELIKTDAIQSGIYFLRLHTSKGVATKKMIVVR